MSGTEAKDLFVLAADLELARLTRRASACGVA